MKRLLFFLSAIFVSVTLFSACSLQKAVSPIGDDAQSKETKTDSVSAEGQSSLGKIEVIEKEDGTKIAKSEFGLEVECSGENFMRLYDEYEKVKEKDAQKEAELLEKIQLILEAQMGDNPLAQ